jgi:uridine kinase
MAIRVLLDHGVPEDHIIFLAFLISRHGQRSIQRAFPRVQIVTAAIDAGLQEMHLPMMGLILGEAAGEADFAVRLVDAPEDVAAEGSLDQLDGEERGDQAGMGDGFKLPATQAEQLKFSRKKREEGMASEKRAWVVSPGMGHIG